ncbi:MAG: hypothetical protein IPL21_05920 [Saprospirales bacterium]|nr:hypothetical protein [Saprospirales bacterium]
MDDGAIATANADIYSRQFNEQEIFVNKQNPTVANPPLFTLDLHYNPEERGQYNYETEPTTFSKGVDPSRKLKKS